MLQVWLFHIGQRRPETFLTVSPEHHVTRLTAANGAESLAARDYRRSGGRGDPALWLTSGLEGRTALVPHACPETGEKATDVSEFNEMECLQRYIYTIFKQ